MTRSIYVVNRSGLVAAADVALWVPAWQEQLNQHLRAFWTDLDAFQLQAVDREPTGEWRLVLEDGVAGAKGDLGYHDPSGAPRATVDPAMDARYGCTVSITAGHELCEMAVDPCMGRSLDLRDGSRTYEEVCDPWSIDRYSYQIGGVRVPNFATPAYWVEGGPTAGVRMDMMDIFHGTYPALPPGGYAMVLPRGASAWTSVRSPVAADHAPEEAAAAHYRASTSARARAIGLKR